MGHAVGLVELSIVRKVKHGKFAFQFSCGGNLPL